MSEYPNITKPRPDRYSNFHMYPNCFECVGAEIGLHEHPHDHLGVLPGGCIWRVTRIQPGEEPKVEEIDVPERTVLLIGIPAPWRHSFVYVGPSELPPSDKPVQWCVFADYDANGKFLPDPKEAT